MDPYREGEAPLRRAEDYPSDREAGWLLDRDENIYQSVFALAWLKAKENNSPDAVEEAHQLAKLCREERRADRVKRWVETGKL